ncbi:MAG: hypothetical protein QHC65_15080 [Sphingomonas sp.]|nr:hypothetical protein [Sphingomonas sp.]MDX3885743.1 hypothetical protein [Sphingomonas sp.]
MPEIDGQKGYIIDRDKLHANYPTQFHDAAFCEELGRTVATFGFIEEMLGKAIFALTGAKEFDPQGDPDAFNAWIKTLEKTLTDQLGGLIIGYEKALAENPRTKGNDYSIQLAELKKAKDIRNALCHGSWSKPDDQGRSVPKFVNRKLLVFKTRVDVQFLKQTRNALAHIICDIFDSVTSVGYSFPGSYNPGEQIWPHLSKIKP